MCKCEGSGVHRFDVAWEVTRRADLALFRTTLTSSEKVLTWKNFVNEGVLVGRGIRVIRIGSRNAKGLEI